MSEEKNTKKETLDLELSEEEKIILFTEDEPESKKEKESKRRIRKREKEKKTVAAGREERRERTPGTAQVTEKPREKKNWKIKRVFIIGGIIALFLLILAAQKIAKGMIPPSVAVTTVKRGEIQKTLDTSGTFCSMKQKIYFAPVSAPVSKCSVKVGDVVKKGDKLVEFDLTELYQKQEEASLQKDSNYYAYSDTLEKSREAERDLSEAENQITRLKNLISVQESNIENIQNYLDELTRRQKKEAEEEKASTNTNKSQKSSNIESLLSSSQRDLERAQADLADFESDLAKYESQKTQAESGILTEDEKKKLEIDQYSAQLSAEAAGKTVAKGGNGIFAEFEGIVTDVKTPTGSMATQGGELLTIQSNKEIYLEVELSKYDLEVVEEGQNATITLGDYTYQGIVNKVSRAARKNEQGKSSILSEIKILNPDEHIYLGIEAKATIEGKKYTNILTIPMESVNISKEESFCYVIEENQLKKCSIETGTSDGQRIQVVEGLEEGQQVVLKPNDTMAEGQKALAIEQEAEVEE